MGNWGLDEGWTFGVVVLVMEDQHPIQGYTMHWHAEITPDELKEDETIRLQFIETARELRDTNKRFI